SFSRASRKLSLSQSVVSFHIEALEKELGVTLFRRQGRTIALTREGKLLYEEGKKLAQEAQRLEDAFASHSATIAQRIYLGGDALTCAFTLPWTLAAFREAYPDVLFTYQHLDREAIVEKLISGELDMALIGHPIQHRKLMAQECFRDEIILVAAPDKAPDKITLNDLRHLPLLWVTSDRGLELLLNQRLSEAGLPPKNLNIFMEVEDLPILKTFIRAGVGMAFLPQLTVADELRFELLKAVTVEGLALERMTYLVYRKEKQPREVVTRFLDFVQKRRWKEAQGEQKGARNRRALGETPG
ncbi:MAG: LysR substrate-binding domain-containing protein, partial [Anaerolineales bacterium]